MSDEQFIDVQPFREECPECRELGRGFAYDGRLHFHCDNASHGCGHAWTRKIPDAAAAGRPISGSEP